MIEEWRELSKLINTYLGPLPTLIGERRPPAHDVQPGGRRHRTAVDLEPEPPGDPDPHRAWPRDPLGVRRGDRGRSSSPPTTRRSSCGSSPTSPASRSCARRSSAGRTSTRRPRRRCSARSPATLTKGERAIAKMINFGIIYGISAFGLSENLEIPREQAQEYIDAYLARFPHVQDFIARTIEEAARDGYVTELLGRRRPVPEIRAAEPPDPLARRAAGGQLRHAGLERGHHQGGDDPHPPPARGTRGASARLVLQVHDELLLEVPDAEAAPSRSSSARRCAAPTRSTRRSPSTSAPAPTGTRRRTDRRIASPPFRSIGVTVLG